MSESLSVSVWLSLKPKFASLIMNGEKSVELRRVAPRIEPGENAVIYASSPVMQIIGVCEIVEVLEMPKSLLWRTVGQECGVTSGEFDTYFSGRKTAFGLRLGRTWSVATPVPLSDIRNSWKDFFPPQSYRYLVPSRRTDELALRLVGSAEARFSLR